MAVVHHYPPYGGQAGGRTERVSVSATPLEGAPPGTAPVPGGLRRYTLHTSQPQREPDQPRKRVVDESADRPRVRSASLLFDALYAQAVDDARLLAVDEISDAAYNEGQPVAARVFQTGEFWTWVWTRDLAYAAHLGLATFDPERVASALLFKTSGWRDGVSPPASLPAGACQIVQDTGSGGSWPVSSDRVSWAWAAEAVLDALPPAERTAFAEAAWAALRGTVEADREAVWNARSGLYGGEQSFLDWRTQSYAPWIEHDLTRMATSQALSTNCGHHQALRLAARLAGERGDEHLAERYAGWADELALAINRVFWLDERQQYASMTSADGMPLQQVDLLGAALVVLSGIAPPGRAREALAHYPHAPFGAPVIAPQQPGVAVYHNRAIWPFVSAYAARAAAEVGNPVLVQHAIDSLMRGAALHLSNMENLEWLTATARHDDGPVINSRRQLWSVAGYLGLVAELVFGLHLVAGGLQLRPCLTAATSRMLAGDAAPGTAETSGSRPEARRHAELLGLTVLGHPLDVRLHLPALPEQGTDVGIHEFVSLRLNGRALAPTATIGLADLDPHANLVELGFGPPQPGDHRMSTVPDDVATLSHDDPRVFAPPTPVMAALPRQAPGDALALQLADGALPAGAHYKVWRNGELVQQRGHEARWVDPVPRQPGRRHSYTVQAVSAQGLHSHHSAALHDGADARLFVPVTDARVQASQPPAAPGDGLALATLRDWGGPQDSFRVGPLVLARAGTYAISLHYNAHHQDIQTGVTATVKRLRLLDAQGHALAHGVVQMPNVQPEALADGSLHHPLRLSTELVAELPAGPLHIELLDYFNMSYLAANAHYGHAGGASGPLNRCHLAGVVIDTLA
ncbi:MAG: hypothetical protein RLZZ584_1743 [Pseudomonadota bacterium]|jgi:hypothetical protein